MDDYKNCNVRSPYKIINIIKKSEETTTDINNTNSSNYIYSKKNIISNDMNKEDYSGINTKDNDSNFSVSQRKTIKNKIMSEDTKRNKISLATNLQNLIKENTKETLIKKILFKDQSTNTNGQKIFFNKIINDKIHSKISDTKLIHNSDFITRSGSKLNINTKNKFRASANYRYNNGNDNYLYKYKNSENTKKNNENKIGIKEKIIATNINSDYKKKNSLNKKEKFGKNAAKEKNNTFTNDFIKTFYSTYSNGDLSNSSYNIRNNNNLMVENNKKTRNNLNCKSNSEIPINLNKNVYKIINSVLNSNSKSFSIRELHRQIFLSTHPYRHSKSKKIIKLNLNKKKKNNFYAPPNKCPKTHLKSVGMNEFELNSKIYLFSKRNKSIDGFSFKNYKDKRDHNFIFEEKKSDVFDEGLRNYKMNVRVMKKIVINCEMNNKKEQL